MPDIKNNMILQEFSERIVVFENCEKSLNNLISIIFDSNDIVIHSITSRTKTLERLQEKLERKNKYKSLDEITDIVGIRIITYFEDEIDLIAKLLSEQFEIDPENSIDKREIENDRFGYKSLHYVAQFTKERLKLLEYKPYKKIKFEIQIRSILQHCWAEIEHDIGYKGEFEIPDIAKRTFSRIAALLETADIEFVRLKTMLKDYEAKTLESIDKKLDDIEIDGVTLHNYVTTSNLIGSQKRKIAEFMNFIKKEDYITTSEYGKWIQRLKKMNINTIKELDNLIEKYEAENIDYAMKSYDGHKISKLNNAAPIICLINYLESINYSG